MKIKIGSENPVKVGAVEELVGAYEILSGAVVEGVDSSSDVGEQPKSIEETVRGAINRAKNSFVDCDFSFGIEDGLISAPETKTGFLNTTFCAIYDGKDVHIGMGCGFEMPSLAVELATKEGIDLSEALHRVGITKEKRIGYGGGIISDLTKGRMTRKERVKQAVQMALIHLENRDLY